MSIQTLTPEEEGRITRSGIEAIQERRLREMLDVIAPTNRFYQRKFRKAGLEPFRDIRSLADLQRAPFTTKDELVRDQENHPPFGTNLTYPLTRYVRLHQTSGTTGRRQLRWLDTPESWDWLMRCWATIFAAAGIVREDRFFFPFSFGPFLGFWAGFEGAVRAGHLTMSGGAMNSLTRLHFMLENRATVVGCTPTYALHLAETARENDIDLAESPVRALIVAGEPGGSIPEVRRQIETAWGARLFDHAGMTEVGSIAFECLENPGGQHVMETECIVEAIDPKKDRPVEPGEEGELVLTNLGRWGSPLIRYRTGDLVCVDAQPCPCGRSHVRLKGGILGRVDDMVYIRGNNFYPSALEAVVRQFPEVLEYEAEVARREGLVALTLTVETDAPVGTERHALPARLASAVREAFHFTPELKFVKRGKLPRYEFKAARFKIDPSYYGKRSETRKTGRKLNHKDTKTQRKRK